MKIGVYGGTFNPIHTGHMAAAQFAGEYLGLDRLLLIPAGIPPHKRLAGGSPGPEHRLAMTRLAAEAIGPQAEAIDLELRREGRSYTADTLRELRKQYPGDKLYLLMGTDMFLTLQAWHEPGEIFDLAGIAAFGRTEEDTEELFAVQRKHLYTTYPNARIFTLTIPGVVDVSSTELRAKLAAGKGSELLPPAVYGCILREGLYQTNADLKHLDLTRLRPVALSYLNYRRIPHVLGTEQEAIRLAVRWGADVDQARRAALLHDCTKRLNLKEQLALCRQWEIPLDSLEEQELKLLHSRTGAEIAERVFGEVPEIVSAIRWHTTGRAGMTLLEKIIYLADYIEPSRDFPGVEDLRRKCYEDLNGGLLMGLEMTVQEMTAQGRPIHPATLEARDELLN